MNKKEQHLKELGKLDEKVLERLVELSKNPKAVKHLSSPLSFSVLKGLLNKF